MEGQVNMSSPYSTISLKHFVADTLKGSFYANPVQGDPTASPEERHTFPEYYGENICD